MDVQNQEQLTDKLYFVFLKKDDEWDWDWREKFVNIIAKDREIDADLKGQIKRQSCRSYDHGYDKKRVIESQYFGRSSHSFRFYK